MHTKFVIKNEKLEWYKKRSLFTKWVMQNKSDTLAATPLNENNST